MSRYEINPRPLNVEFLTEGQIEPTLEHDEVIAFSKKRGDFMHPYIPQSMQEAMDILSAANATDTPLNSELEKKIRAREAGTRTNNQ